MDEYMKAACWIVCPMCDEPKCVGRFNCPEIKAWVEKKKNEEMAMGKQHLSRDDRLIMKGKLQGTRENMDMIGMVLQDKFGWHVREETPDGHDTMSLEYLFNCIVELTQEINNGYVKRKDIRKTLADEYKVAFTEGEE